MAFKKDTPFVQKVEEKTGQDVDHDGEKGESPAHKAKVKAAAAKNKEKMAPPFVKGGGKGKGKGKACPKCGKMPCVCK
jgi:hypothetical protein